MQIYIKITFQEETNMSMAVAGGLYGNYAAQNVNDRAKKKEAESN